MERERATQRVVMEDGQEGVILEHDPVSLRVKVRLDNGTEEWVDIEKTSGVETASAHPSTMGRELGS